MSKEPREIVAFEATLPDSGDWIKVNRDEGKVTLVVPVMTAGLLAAKTGFLDAKTLVVKILVED